MNEEAKQAINEQNIIYNETENQVQLQITEESSPLETQINTESEHAATVDLGQATEETTPMDLGQGTVNPEEPKTTQKTGPLAERIDLDRIEAKEKQRLEERRIQDEKINAVIDKLREFKENKQRIEVIVKARIRGGLRVDFEDAPLFLPASHFAIKKSPTEEELVDAIGHKMEVVVHEIHDNEQVRNSIIVSRKAVLEEELWEKIKVGNIIEGRISSIASFGVFVDLGCVEGLIHISRLSKLHIEDPTKFVKKGDLIQAVVYEIDRDKNRVSLSRKELEDSPWKGINKVYKPETTHKGIIKRITDFGAYVELSPGIDGLIRLSELSWTRRLKHPNEVVKLYQEIDVYIISVNEEKQAIALSYKRTLPNPWQGLKEKYPPNSEAQGKVLQLVPQGAVITVGDEVDGFMPRSRMRPILKGRKIPFNEGDIITVVINDIIPEEESLILNPRIEERAAFRSSPHKESSKVAKEIKDNDNSGFTFNDFLTEEQKKGLLGSIE